MSELREKLFGFIVSGFEEEDCPTFAAALDEYVAEREDARLREEAVRLVNEGHVQAAGFIMGGLTP